MKIFLDTNILVDVLLDYRLNHADSLTILSMAENGDISVICSTQSVIDASYVILQRNHLPLDVFKKILGVTLMNVSLSSISPDDINDAIASPMSDFEDAAQISCALNSGCSLLVSSDKGLKHNGVIPVLTPSEFLSIVFGE